MTITHNHVEFFLYNLHIFAYQLSIETSNHFLDMIISHRGRLVRRMISEGMKSVKGMEPGRNWNGMLSGLTKCLVDRNGM